MDRKGILILFTTAAIVIGWYFGFQQPYEQAKQKNKPVAEAPNPQPKPSPDSIANGKETAPGIPFVSSTPPAPDAPVIPEATEETLVVTSPAGTVDYKFTNLGGGILSTTLKEHRAEDKSRNMVLNEFGSVPIGATSQTAGKLDEIRLPWKMSADKEKGVVTFVRTDAEKKLEITKTYTLPQIKGDLKSEYVVTLKVEYKNFGEKIVTLPDYHIYTGSISAIHQRDARHYIGFQWLHDTSTSFEAIDWFSAGGMLLWKHEARPVFNQTQQNVTWGGVVNQYFTSMITVITDEKLAAADRAKLRGKGIWATRADISDSAWVEAGRLIEGTRKENGQTVPGKNPLQRVFAAIVMPGFDVVASTTETKEFQIYAGPREYRRLRLLANNESGAMQYGTFMGIPTGPFSKMLLNALNWFYSWCGNYAVAIILLTILVKSILWPLQNRANRQMKKMALLQPQIKQLQEKYKADPMKFQQEMGRLWKSYGVNPLNSCWPMLLQIPIFVGFYNMLDKAVEIRDHGFLWVKDLASPDTIYMLAGVPINPLPLCMAATMLLQMKMTPQTGDPAQRKIFMFMPLIFIFICYNFASALALYWTVQNLLSIVQLLINKNQEQPSLEKIAVITPKRR